MNRFCSPYYLGSTEELPWSKLEEYGYQLFLDGEIFLPDDDETLNGFVKAFIEESWMYSEEDKVAIIHPGEHGEKVIRYRATDEGRELLDCMFDDYARIFMD